MSVPIDVNGSKQGLKNSLAPGDGSGDEVLMCFLTCSLRVSVLCRPVLHFFCVLVPHLQNRDNSTAPLHKVIAEITMLRCYGNKGCVILKIARDAEGRELACVKHGLLKGKDGANQPSLPPSILSQRSCAWVSHAGTG